MSNKVPTLVKAIAFKGEKGDTLVSVTIGTTTTGAAGTNAAVENVGTETEAILNFTIPRGDTGTSITSIAKTASTGFVDTYTITMSDGTTYTFEVRNGEHKQEYITQAQYDALVLSGDVDPDTYYYIIDDDTLDEINDAISDLQDDVSDLQSGYSSMQTDISGLSTDVFDLQSATSVLNSDVSYLQSRMTDVNNLKETLNFGDANAEFSVYTTRNGGVFNYSTVQRGLYVARIYDHTTDAPTYVSTEIIYFDGTSRTLTGVFYFYMRTSASSTAFKPAYLLIDQNGHVTIESTENGTYFQHYTVLLRQIGTNNT